MNDAISSIFRRPTKEEADRYVKLYGVRPYALFWLLLRILREPQCAKKLPCLRDVGTLFLHTRRRLRRHAQHTTKEDETQRRYREAFSVCWRVMGRRERRHVRTEILWHIYCCTESQSEAHAQLYDLCCDPRNDPAFYEWRRQHNMLGKCSFEAFQMLVHCGITLSPADFTAMWQPLNQYSKGALLLLWDRMVHCACSHIAVKEKGSLPMWEVRLTENTPAVLV